MRTLKQDKKRFMFTMLGPAVIILFILTIFPFIYSVYMSIHEFHLANPKSGEFIGLAHYIKIIFRDPQFWQSLKLTMLYVILAVGSQLILSMAIAMALNSTLKAKSIFQTAFILPLGTAPIAAAFVWRIMFNPSLGIINYFLSKFGFTVDWLGNPNLALISVVIVDTWRWTPFMILIFLAGLMSLPKTPFEAARVDGANKWQTFTKITLPLMKPLIMIAVLFRLIRSFRAFDFIFVMTGGGPGTSTQTLNIYTFITSFRYLKVGIAAAMSIIMLFTVFFICQFIIKQSKLGF